MMMREIIYITHMQIPKKKTKCCIFMWNYSSRNHNNNYRYRCNKQYIAKYMQNVIRYADRKQNKLITNNNSTNFHLEKIKIKSLFIVWTSHACNKPLRFYFVVVKFIAEKYAINRSYSHSSLITILLFNLNRCINFLNVCSYYIDNNHISSNTF